MKEKGSVAVLIILLAIVLMGWAVYSGRINVMQGNKKQEKQQTATTVVNSQDRWQTFNGANGKFSVNYPPTWKVTKMPESEDFIGMKLEGKEGYVDLMWGAGFGGYCPSGYEKLQVKNEELPVCHEFMEDGAEHWRDISKVLDKEIGFSGRGVAYTPVSKNRETILKILSTLDFASK